MSKQVTTKKQRKLTCVNMRESLAVNATSKVDSRSHVE